MSDLLPTLFGTAGFVDGETFVLPEGLEVVIGRSRSCPISLRRVPGYLRASPTIRDNDHDFNTVSRRHLRLTVTDGVASIEDLSTNGSSFNGESIGKPLTVDLNTGGCCLRLGTRETFELALVAADDPRIAGKPPVTIPSGVKDTEQD